jgi:hypothetical protein
MLTSIKHQLNMDMSHLHVQIENLSQDFSALKYEICRKKSSLRKVFFYNEHDYMCV